MNKWQIFFTAYLSWSKNHSRLLRLVLLMILIGTPAGVLSTRSGFLRFLVLRFLAQDVSAAPQPVGQGGQIVLNGRTLRVPWHQWQLSAGPASARIGLSDMGLLNLGVDLLDTDDLQQQPVQWFSDSRTTPILLPIRRTSTARYLDITDLARQSGWQLQQSGSTLQIVTPTATVRDLRRGKHPWGERIVLDLDRPALWQVEPAGATTVVTIDARVPPELLSRIQGQLGQGPQAVQLDANAQLLRFRIPTAANRHAQLWSLPNPNRLIIDLRPPALVPRNILWVPGLRWRQQSVALNNKYVPVTWLEIDPRQPNLRVQPILPNPASMMGTAPLAQTVQRTQVAAAINGGFFNRNRQLPLGAIRQDGQWASGPILNRGAIAWNSDGSAMMGRLSLQETVTTSTGQSFPITHLNSGYIQAGVARYTALWGASYMTLSDGEVVVMVDNNRVIGQQVIATAGQQAIPIPMNGYLLVCRANQTVAKQLLPGLQLTLSSTAYPAEFNRYSNIIGAGPLLIEQGQVVLDPKTEQFSGALANGKAARSGIGRTANGSILLVAASGSAEEQGITLTEMAQLMAQLGASDALNLDGGSSTTLMLGGQVLNRSPSSMARVHNGIGVLIRP